MLRVCVPRKIVDRSSCEHSLSDVEFLDVCKAEPPRKHSPMCLFMRYRCSERTRRFRCFKCVGEDVDVCVCVCEYV